MSSRQAVHLLITPVSLHGILVGDSTPTVFDRVREDGLVEGGKVSSQSWPEYVSRVTEMLTRIHRGSSPQSSIPVNL